MKKTLHWGILCLFLALPVLNSCNDEDPVIEEIPGLDSTFNTTYSDGSETGLYLTYSGNDLKGKSAKFELKDILSADITITGVFMDENRVEVKNVQLQEAAAGYYFTGNSTTSGGTAFTFTGSVTQRPGEEFPSMKLALDNVNISPNYLSTYGTFKMPNYSTSDVTIATRQYNRTHTSSVVLWWTYGDPDDEDDENMLLEMNLSALGTILGLFGIPADGNSLLHSFISKIMFVVLDDVTFKADGTLVATYCQLKEDFELMSAFTGRVSESDRG